MNRLCDKFREVLFIEFEWKYLDSSKKVMHTKRHNIGFKPFHKSTTRLSWNSLNFQPLHRVFSCYRWWPSLIWNVYPLEINGYHASNRNFSSVLFCEVLLLWRLVQSRSPLESQMKIPCKNHYKTSFTLENTPKISTLYKLLNIYLNFFDRKCCQAS